MSNLGERVAGSGPMQIVDQFVGYEAVYHQGLTMRHYKNKKPRQIYIVFARLPITRSIAVPFTLRQDQTYEWPVKAVLDLTPYKQISPLTTIQSDLYGYYWKFITADGKWVNKCDRDLEETVELSSHQVTRIQVVYYADEGLLCGLIFFSGE